MTIEQITSEAQKLGITLTNAEIGTELCQAWADRVEQAAMQFSRGEMKGFNTQSNGGG
jgi:hypothetical protein